MFDGPTTAGEHVFDAPVISLDLSEITDGVAAVNLPIAIAMVCAVAFLDAKRIQRAERARQAGRELEKTIRINDEAWRALPIAGLGRLLPGRVQALAQDRRAALARAAPHL